MRKQDSAGEDGNVEEEKGRCTGRGAGKKRMGALPVMDGTGSLPGGSSARSTPWPDPLWPNGIPRICLTSLQMGLNHCWITQCQVTTYYNTINLIAGFGITFLEADSWAYLGSKKLIMKHYKFIWLNNN
jgi:hypothetical protein